MFAYPIINAHLSRDARKGEESGREGVGADLSPWSHEELRQLQPLSGRLLRGADGPRLRQTSESAGAPGGARFRRAKPGRYTAGTRAASRAPERFTRRRASQRARLADGRIPARVDTALPYRLGACRF